MKKLVGLLFVMHCSLQGFTLDRVILSTDTNPMYFDFWEPVAMVWKQVVGVRPTLALIASEETSIDTSIGDVIRFDPMPGVPTWFHAQVIRLFLPLYFENDTCIISDIDLIPLNKDYFAQNVAPFDKNMFVVFRDRAYFPEQRYPMCYLAGLGKTFKDILGVQKVDDISATIARWWQLYAQDEGFGWSTDEKVFTRFVDEWHKKTGRCVRLGHTVERRVDRADFVYNQDLVKDGYYIDSHMVRPYKKYKSQIDELINTLIRSRR